MLTDETIIDDILVREGGGKFTDRADDRGGPTRWGITAETLGKSRGLGRDATPAEVSTLSEAEARDIYRLHYITMPFGKITHPQLRAVLADCCVLHGEGNAVRMLQRVLKVKDDGKLGPVTLAAALAADGLSLARRVGHDRIRFLGRHITGDLTDADKDGIPDATENASGWLNRTADQLDQLEELT